MMSESNPINIYLFRQRCFLEPIIAWDSYSERLVKQALAMFQSDRTVLVVAHRLSTITGADQILVLGQGEVAVN
jgi:ABC-type multidrug transport system fused ATPase/permease subunit